MDYKRLLEKIKPTIQFNYGDEVIEYKINYENISQDNLDLGGRFKFRIKFLRLTGNEKITVANKVLLSILRVEYHEMQKYLGNNYFDFMVEEIDVCI